MATIGQKPFIRLLRIDDVCRTIGLGKTKIYEMVREGEFPPPVALTSRSRAWRQDEVQKWIDSRPVIDLEVA